MRVEIRRDETLILRRPPKAAVSKDGRIKTIRAASFAICDCLELARRALPSCDFEFNLPVD
jgi:hypothetical protein